MFAIVRIGSRPCCPEGSSLETDDESHTSVGFPGSVGNLRLLSICWFKFPVEIDHIGSGILGEFLLLQVNLVRVTRPEEPNLILQFCWSKGNQVWSTLQVSGIQVIIPLIVKTTWSPAVERMDLKSEPLSLHRDVGIRLKPHLHWSFYPVLVFTFFIFFVILILRQKLSPHIGMLESS